MAWSPGQRITAQRLRDGAPWVVSYTAITATTPTTTSTTLTAAITTDPLAFRAGRAYRISFRGGLVTSVLGQQGTVAITKGTATGSVLLNAQRIATAEGQLGTMGFYFENILTVGTDTTTALVGAYAIVNQLSGGNVAIFGSSATPSYLEVMDIGLAADFPSATPL